ncbi:CHAT domain-containing protein [Streptomyces sp. NPDC056708]|uniref:CHAT domain-containing protein n=1 Tax=unclassified Streptomyces TaxID=2593676 RepID=UPI00367AB1BE
MLSRAGQTIVALLTTGRPWQSSDTALLERLARMAAASPADEHVAMLLGLLRWCRYTVHSDQADLDAAVTGLAPFFLPGRIDVVPVGLRGELADSYASHFGSQLARVHDDAEGLSQLARWCRWVLSHADLGTNRHGQSQADCAGVLFRRYLVVGEFHDLVEAISRTSSAVRVTPVGDPGGPLVRHNLAMLLTHRFNVTRSDGDLHAAYQASETALRLPLADETRGELASSFRALLSERTERALREHRWDEALACARVASGHPEMRGFGQDATADALFRRFQQNGAPVADLDQAIELWKSLLHKPPADAGSRHRTVTLESLSLAYWRRYHHQGHPRDLDAAITHAQANLDAPETDGSAQRNLVVFLLERLQHDASTSGSSYGDRQKRHDIEWIIATSRRRLTTHDDRTFFADALALALKQRFMSTRRAEDLDEAVRALESVAAESVVITAVTVWRDSEISHIHSLRYKAGRGIGALKKSVASAERAVASASPGGPRRSEAFVTLSQFLIWLFAHSGDLSELDRAVDCAREAVRAVPTDPLSTSERPIPLIALGRALTERSHHTGSLDDANEAVETLRRVSDPSGQALLALGMALSTRAERTASALDLDEAVQLLRRSARQDHADRPSALTGLAEALLRRYRRDGDPAALDEALALARRAVAAVPQSDLEYLHGLTVLVGVLSVQRQFRPQHVDIDELVGLATRVVELSSSDSADFGIFLHNMAMALMRRIEADDPISAMIQTASEMDPPRFAGVLVVPPPFLHPEVRRSANALTAAARSAALAPRHRINSAFVAAALVAGSELPWAQNLLREAIGLIPLVAPRRISRADQQHALKDLSELVTYAAAVILNPLQVLAPDLWGNPLPPDLETRSLQILEQGRAVLLSQMLDLRGDVSELRRLDPELADRFLHLRDALDNETPSATDRHRAAAELSATIEAIRGREGFASFARPPEPKMLVAEAAQGPIVVFNCHPLGCDALLVTSDGVSHLMLPDLTYDETVRQVDLFHHAITAAQQADDWRVRRDAQRTLEGTLAWLWDVAAGPVLTELGIGPGEGALPRVWWSPGGLLGSLPLHAAGHHSHSAPGGPGRTVMDRVVSSYTPTIRALRHARRTRAACSGPRRSLVVAMPFTPQAPPLPGVLEEAEAVAARLPGATVLTGYDGEAPATTGTVPTRETVLAHLTGVSAVHLACHAVTDHSDPSRGGLLLWDHETAPLTVAGISAAVLDNAELAYLSACRTHHTSATGLLDEAIHLTSAFQLAGFRHVVGTLWEADDVMSERIADSFYVSLTGADGPDYACSATALHTAVRAARDDFPRTPSLWAGYVHAGA